MTTFVDVQLNELFHGVNGHQRFIKSYLDAHRGEYPVYSASLEGPFGMVDTYDFEGHHLTWVLNGYGGRVQELRGKFSANRDRGVLVPRKGVRTPDLTYVRFAVEPIFVAAAVGRRVDGRRNDYTKLYPPEALAQTIRVPVDGAGRYDYAKMKQLGARLCRIEEAQASVRKALEEILAARVTIESLVAEDEAEDH